MITLDVCRRLFRVLAFVTILTSGALASQKRVTFENQTATPLMFSLAPLTTTGVIVAPYSVYEFDYVWSESFDGTAHVYAYALDWSISGDCAVSGGIPGDNTAFRCYAVLDGSLFVSYDNSGYVVARAEESTTALLAAFAFGCAFGWLLLSPLVRR